MELRIGFLYFLKIVKVTKMNKEELKKRLELIEAQIKQTMANYNMLAGGKEEILYWLAELEKPIEVESQISPGCTE